MNWEDKLLAEFHRHSQAPAAGPVVAVSYDARSLDTSAKARAIRKKRVLEYLRRKYCDPCALGFE